MHERDRATQSTLVDSHTAHTDAQRTGASERAMRLTCPFDSRTDTAARNVRSIMSAIDLRWEVNDGEFVPRGETT